eukprot:13445278-Ditylum_brightwellii.AAC.1
MVLRSSVNLEIQQSVHRRNMSVRRIRLEDIHTDMLELSGVDGTDFVSVFECNRGDVTMERF